MSDNRPEYRIIRIAIKQLFPIEPNGNFARKLTTLAAMVAVKEQLFGCKVFLSMLE
jgi:hypothetical protein